MPPLLPPHRSFWLQQSVGDELPLAPLTQNIATDICIIGGGFVGLWTAIRIKEQSPTTDVVILERDICGGGASGRCGGFILSWLPKLSSLIHACGVDDAIYIVKESQKCAAEIERFCAQHNINAHFKWSPWLWAATSQAQIGAWQSVARLAAKHNIDGFKNIVADQAARLSGSAAHIDGIIDTTAATLHPGYWVRGLRRVALQMGVKIFENTPMISFKRQHPLSLKTPHNTVTTNKIVIANNAWAAAIPELSSAIIPITSDMIMTAPAEKELQKIGWNKDICITDSQMMVDYYQITQDHRVAFGKGGWGIAFGGSIGKDFDRNITRSKKVEEDFRSYYPTLDDIAVTHDWCGPIDRTANSLPLLGSFKKNPNILYGVGWSGNGIGPSVIGGRVLASLALNKNDTWACFPLIGKTSGRFPPEPIRFIGAHVVRTAVHIKERAEIVNKKPPRLAVMLSSLAPKGLEDKE